MECVGFAIEEADWFADDPAAPANIITATKVRKLPVGQFIERGRRMEAGSHEIVSGLLIEEGRHDEARLQREASRRFKAQGQAGGRRPFRDDDHYRKVATIYTEAWRTTGAPTRAVEEHFAPVHHSTAARWVQECRRRGFLAPTAERKAGGILTRKTESKEDA